MYIFVMSNNLENLTQKTTTITAITVENCDTTLLTSAISTTTTTIPCAFNEYGNNDDQTDIDHCYSRYNTVYEDTNYLKEFNENNLNLNHKNSPVENSPYENFFTKNLLLNSDFWKDTNNKISNIIYENLCENCGYGVFDANGKYCNFCEFTLNGNLKESGDVNEEKIQIEVEQDYEEDIQNIYENICEKCGEIYSGKECNSCNVVIVNEKFIDSVKTQAKTLNKPLIIENKISKFKKSKIISGLVGTLKKVRSKTSSDSINSSNSSAITNGTTKKSKIKKLNIIHNVDGYDNVFRTQETFDLNRICELKNHNKEYRLQSNSDQHLYGKLRKSDEQLLFNFARLKNDNSSSSSVIKLSGNSKSDTTLHRIQSFTCSSPSQINNYDLLKLNRTPFNEKRSVYNRYHYNNHQNEQFNKSSNNNNNNSNNNNQIILRYDHVIEWMTSLRNQIHEYVSYLPDDSICSIKSIPSRNFSCCGLLNEISSDLHLPVLFSSHQQQQQQHQRKQLSPSFDVFGKTGEDEEATLRSLFTNNDLDYTQMVDNFKRHLMEKQQRSKRKAIYLKIDDDDDDDDDFNNNFKINNNNSNTNNIFESNDNFESLTIDSLNSTLLQSTTDTTSFNNINNRRRRRYGFHENNNKDSDFVNDLLNAFDSFLKRDDADNQITTEQNNHPEVLRDNNNKNNSVNEVSIDEINTIIFIDKNESNYENFSKSTPISRYNNLDTETTITIVPFLSENCVTRTNRTSLIINPLLLAQKININELITYSLLSKSLNCIVLNSDRFLSEFLRAINLKKNFATCKFSQLHEIFVKLYSDKNLQFSILSRKRSTKKKKIKNKENTLTSKLIKKPPLPLLRRPLPPVPLPRYLKSSQSTYSESSHSHSSMTAIEILNPIIINNQSENININEDIYQPIWKFKTVGNPRESYVSESDYYDITSIYDDSSTLNAVEDHGEWEIDDEFMFSKKIKETTKTMAMATITAAADSTNLSSNDSIETQSMTSSSIIISESSKSLFGDSMMIPSSPYRNVCIIYSVTEPKIRAILYEYDLMRRSYSINSISDTQLNSNSNNNNTNSNNNSNKNNNNNKNSGCVTVTVSNRINQQQQQVQIQIESPVSSPSPSSSSLLSSKKRYSESYKNAFIPDCVQAWKFMLLDTFYADDEEDMYVSEDEILKLRQIETEVVSTGATLQRFKSVSSDNLLEIPRDKKSLSERFRNKLQRGVLKLNRSPKDKKGKLFSKRTDSTSLYLEDGVKPKYPIFGAPLQDVEKDDINVNVPKFVVDCIEYIEIKDNIQSDGLYRASGNKIAIDDLKKKLSESFVYDCKIFKNQDVHTVTGLLKLFFRELKTSLIPNEIYKKLPENLVDKTNIPIIKRILQSTPQPGKGTLQYLLKHLQNVAYYSSENRMPASNLAIIWGPCILFSVSTSPFDIARMNTLTKILIENYDAIFADNERLVN